MDFTLSEQHEALRDTARAFLEREFSLSALLTPGATVEQAPYDELWQKIADLGWAGAVIAEPYGGSGMSYIDLAMIIGEMGRTLASAPFFGTLAGTWAIEAAGSEEQKTRLLPPVASGKCRLALAVAGPRGIIDLNDGAVTAVEQASGYRLTGTRSLVMDAAAADAVIFAAENAGEVEFFLVDRKAVSIELLGWRDVTRQACVVQVQDAPAERLAISATKTWPWIRDRLYLFLAAESAAGALKSVEDAVAYAKQRVAFGKPIGAFQAIKHQLAELVGLCELADAGVHYAAWALSEGDPRAQLGAAMAQSYASEAYMEVTHRNIQIFGALGFSWEMPNHLYYKRARCNAELLGSPSKQREEVVRLLEAQHQS